jgi:sugar O-acyltransferase (sialic acid O-acetyltransferase NeuD family)
LPLVIIGVSGVGREVLDAVDGADPSLAGRFAGFLDDLEPEREILAGLGAAWLGYGRAARRVGGRDVMGIADPGDRDRIAAMLSEAERDVGSVVHNAATIGRDTILGRGVVLTAGARVSTHVRAGDHVQVNPNPTIGHDCLIGDRVTVYPGATVGGNVVLGDRVSVGTGANILQGLSVGDGAFIGAGAVVVRDVAAGETVVGVPARPIY